MGVFNSISNQRVASTILKLLECEKTEQMSPSIEEVTSCGKRDRVLMYNPDAIASWIYEKYRDYFKPLFENNPIELKMYSSIPPVTPVCFASMYSGLAPSVHGIQSYVKPILKCQTIFDLLPQKGKKVAIVSTEGDSISTIFLNRNIDYFIYKTKGECNKKALELMASDKHDLIVLYNGDYDKAMHYFSPEGKPSLKALKENIATYSSLCDKAKEVWTDKKYAIAFAPDHGCHRWFKFLGNHGDDIVQDMNIMHFWTLN